MPEFFKVLSPSDALAQLWQALPAVPNPEVIATADAGGRVTARDIIATEPLPAFARATMDGYAVRARDTFGASQSLPAYLTVAGEVPMGRAPKFSVAPGQAALVHTGGMLPDGADAVVMLEVTQAARHNEVEVLKGVAPGENVLRAGDDVAPGTRVLSAGHRLRPQDIGALSALGITQLAVARRPRVSLLSTGDEVVPPEAIPGPGQVRDVNAYSLAVLIALAGGDALRHSIAPDNEPALLAAASAALAEADALALSAGSSVSARDMTGQVIQALGAPGVLVHGVAVKPGKPTILAVADGKPVFGLPGNPVSALVIADLFLAPTIWRLQGLKQPPPRPSVRARLTHNLASQTGRVDYVPARLRPAGAAGEFEVEPIFGQSNQIFTMVAADGMIVVPLDSTGLSADAMVEVRVF